MAGPNDLARTPESKPFPTGTESLIPPLDENAGPANLFQEINERRARIENAEMLRRLRGL